MKNSGRYILFAGKAAGLLLASVLTGMLALILVYMLPVERMKAHVTSSIDIFYTESVYPQQVQGYKTTQLDNETDAIMLLGAIYEEEGLEAWKAAMSVPHVTMQGEDSLCMVLKNYLWDRMEPDGRADYDRYWHGYMVFLKPLLLLMDYADIRMLNMIIQLTLLLTLIMSMVRKKMERYLPALLMFLIALNPVATAMSLQFSAIYYIILISLLLLLKYQGDERYAGEVYLFFMGIGICVAYFDFLTYPMAAFCVPAGFVLAQNTGDWKANVKKLVCLGICWGSGYLGMWGCKWILGTALLGSNLFAEALGRAGVHTGEVIVEGKTYGMLGVLWRNVRPLLRWPYLLSGMGILIFYMKKADFRFHPVRMKECLPLLLLFLIPPFWIMLLRSHSAWCYWYTYRNLAASAFLAGLILHVLTAKEKNTIH